MYCYTGIISRDLDEVLEQKGQLEKQLQAKLASNAELEASLSDLRGKLELSQVYAQQLNNGEAPAIRPDLYADQIEELKAQNAQLHETIAQVSEDRLIFWMRRYKGIFNNMVLQSDIYICICI